MGTNKYTHILIVTPSQEHEVLYRACDGALIAEALEVAAIFGDEPNKRQSRAFLNHEFAAKFVKDYARKDLELRGLPCTPEDVRIDQREGEGRVILPKGSTELAQMGGPRRMRN